MWSDLTEGLFNSDTRLLSRAISMVENEIEGYEEFLRNLPVRNKSHIIGITGPPGAGKSTLTDGLIETFQKEELKVAVLCIDPSSPFHRGALLGDRIRMNRWYNYSNVYIRSLASRGSLGGACPMIIEITEILKAAAFDKIIIETVGVGQSEVEIAEIADTTIVVLVPESGDDIQSMKAGLMEIADIFVVNKADRPKALEFVSNLSSITRLLNKDYEIPIIQTIAIQNEGIELLIELLNQLNENKIYTEKTAFHVVNRLYKIIQKNRMIGCGKKEIHDLLLTEKKPFNLFHLAKKMEKIVFNKT